MNSLFIGRYQPFHKGHKRLMETILKKGKPIVIAIRNTKVDKNNPYTLLERRNRITEELSEYGELVEVISIPDIDEICYGRNVGYLIRRIQLDKETEAISATKIRNKNKPIFWLTGQSGSGKTALANKLKKELGGVVLDGDEMRQSISVNVGFTKEDREEHNLRVARLAKVLSKDSVIYVSVIAPFQSTRDKITELIDPTWVYIKRDLPTDPIKPYQEPKDAIVIDIDKGFDGVEIIKKLL